MDFKTMTIDDIIEWCQENGQTEWLKKEAKRKVDYKVYPKKRVDGVLTVDKSATPKIEKRSISFIQIKMDFVNKFMPEIIPEKKEKGKTMFDKIAAL